VKFKVYVAGPIRDPDPKTREKNIQFGIREAAILASKGFAPYCPHLDHQYQTYIDVSEEDLMAITAEFLPMCDVLYLLEGWENSEGCKAEREIAIKLGIPICTNEYGQAYEFLDSLRNLKNGK